MERTLADTDPRCSLSDPTLHHQLFQLGNGLGWIEVLRTGLGAAQDRVASVEAEGVFQVVQTLARRLVTAVDHPAICLQQRRWAQISLLVPPVAGAGGRAARAQDAFI